MTRDLQIEARLRALSDGATLRFRLGTRVAVADVLPYIATASAEALDEIEQALEQGPEPAPDLDVAPPVRFVLSDGGREAAGYKLSASDCVVRAIAIATELPYERVHADLEYNSPRSGLGHREYAPYLRWLGWHETHNFEERDVRMRMRADELPTGRLIVRRDRHLVAVIDGVLHDTHDSSRGGTAPVLRIFQRARDCVYRPQGEVTTPRAGNGRFTRSGL